MLLDTGNFVLWLLDGTNIWQSFKHPIDTILQSMKFLVSYKAHVVERLVAWKGPDDPSSGDFSCSGDPIPPNLLFVTRNKTRPYCCLSMWNDMSVSGGTYLTKTNSILYRTAANFGDEFYFIYTISNNSSLMRITLDYTGKLKALGTITHHHGHFLENTPLLHATSMPHVDLSSIATSLERSEHESTLMGSSPSTILSFLKVVEEWKH